MSYLARRILNSALLLLGVSILTFTIASVAPGEFLEELRLNPRISSATISALQKERGLDLSFPLQYLRWLRSALSGDFGTSLTYDRPAGPLMRERAGNTLWLTGTSTLFSWMIALPFGIWSATRRGRLPRLAFEGAISVLLSVPELLLGLLLLLFAVRTGMFPAGGALSFDYSELSFFGKAKDFAKHLFLPALTLTIGFLPLLLSHVRNAVAEMLEAPFALAAYAHGVPFRRLVLRHVLPAAANPLISLFGLSIGALLSSSVLVEGIYSWPGLGQLLIDSILQRDFYLTVDTVMLGTIFLIAGSLFADFLLFLVDPRIRAQ